MENMFATTWKAFAGCDLNEIEKALKLVLKKQNYQYSEQKIAPSFLLGTNQPGIRFTIKSSVNFKISILHAYGDPLVRLIYGAFSSDQRLKGLCHITITPINQKNKKDIRNILLDLTANLANKPQNVTRHPRFRNAFLLKLINNYRWGYWLKEKNKPKKSLSKLLG